MGSRFCGSFPQGPVGLPAHTMGVRSDQGACLFKLSGEAEEAAFESVTSGELQTTPTPSDPPPAPRYHRPGVLTADRRRSAPPGGLGRRNR
ncbi:hypothetical protein GCM10010377_82050 [Streptomyces viridiviolaceus]|nr:hypothetical protein GCM10010377_82050 [Streptomyces viridiviolaceus]